MNILDKIVTTKREEIAYAKSHTNITALERICYELPSANSLAQAIKSQGEINLIAEIKKASPSKGVIREEFNPVEIAKIYSCHGVSAISVLTDINYFKGHPIYLSAVRLKTDLPLLRKDFIIDPLQIYQARLLGADAILLITAILTPEELKEYHRLAESIGLDCLVEVHSREELNTALEAGAKIIGVNNRNLKTFITDLNTTFELKEFIPHDKIIVSESGINTRRDVLALQEAQVDAILVGEAIMREPDVGGKIFELLGRQGGSYDQN